MLAGPLEVPHLEEHVLCVGFPVGGDTVSVTSGVVSRVEVMTYAAACSELLGIQIDAAINSGNSGGAETHWWQTFQWTSKAFICYYVGPY